MEPAQLLVRIILMLLFIVGQFLSASVNLVGQHLLEGTVRLLFLKQMFLLFLPWSRQVCKQ